MEISIKPVTPETCYLYCNLGIKAYKEHYLHLWKNSDPSPYIQKSFTLDVVDSELKDISSNLFLIYTGEKAIGILKIIKDASIAPYSSKEAIFLEKIYLLNEFSGIGLGSRVLSWVETYSLNSNKKILWLETMQKGQALNFYLKNEYKILKATNHPMDEVLPDQKPMYVLFKKLKNT